MSQPNSTAEPHLDAARAAYEKSDFAQCRSEVLKAQSVDPTQKDVHRWLARLAYQARDWEAVREHTSAYLRSSPDNREMLQLRARAFQSLKLWPQAAEAWERIIKLRPDWSEGWYQLARAQARNGESIRAHESAKRLRNVVAHDPEALTMPARIFLELGDLPAAIDTYAAAAKNGDKVLYQELQTHEARESLHGSAAVLSALAKEGHSDELREKIRQLADNLLRKAIAEERRGKFVDAHADYAAVSLLSPGDQLALRSASRVLQKLLTNAEQFAERHELAQAIQVYQDILRASPSNLKAAMQLAKLRTQNQEWGKAAVAWLHVTALSPDYRQSRTLYARCLERSQQFQAACDAWHEVKKLDPANEEAAGALLKIPGRMLRAARLAFSEKRYLDAWQLLSALPADCTEREEADRRLAQLGRYARKEIRAAYKQARYLDAVELSEMALQLLPDDKDLARIAAKAAMRVASYSEAMAAWKRVLVLSEEPDIQHQLDFAKCCLEISAFEEGRSAIVAVLQREPENQRARDLEIDLRARKLTQSTRSTIENAEGAPAC